MISSRVCKAKCLGACERGSLDVAVKMTPGQSDTQPRYAPVVAVLLFCWSNDILFQVVEFLLTDSSGHCLRRSLLKKFWACSFSSPSSSLAVRGCWQCLAPYSALSSGAHYFVCLLRGENDCPDLGGCSVFWVNNAEKGTLESWWFGEVVSPTSLHKSKDLGGVKERKFGFYGKWTACGSRLERTSLFSALHAKDTER